MTVLRARDIKAKARAALRVDRQFLRYVAGYLLLNLIVILLVLPLSLILSAGIEMSGIMPFFQPGGHPEVGLFLDTDVMLPLLGSTLVFSLLVMYPIGFSVWGQSAMSIAAVRRGLTFGHSLSGWGHGWRMGWILAVKWLYVSLWWLLLVVPGIVKFISYSMTEFIAVDHPDWSANRCIAESRRLMHGNKMRYFLFNLSFIGWGILLNVVWHMQQLLLGMFCQCMIVPYYETARAVFYEDLLDRDERKRVTEDAPDAAEAKDGGSET